MWMNLFINYNFNSKLLNIHVEKEPIFLPDMFLDGLLSPVLFDSALSRGLRWFGWSAVHAGIILRRRYLEENRAFFRRGYSIVCY